MTLTFRGWMVSTDGKAACGDRSDRSSILLISTSRVLHRGRQGSIKWRGTVVLSNTFIYSGSEGIHSGRLGSETAHLREVGPLDRAVVRLHPNHMSPRTVPGMDGGRRHPPNGPKSSV